MWIVCSALPFREMYIELIESHQNKMTKRNHHHGLDYFGMCWIVMDCVGIEQECDGMCRKLLECVGMRKHLEHLGRWKMVEGKRVENERGAVEGPTHLGFENPE